MVRDASEQAAGTPRLLALAAFAGVALAAGWVASIPVDGALGARLGTLVATLKPPPGAVATIWIAAYLLAALGIFLVWSAPGSRPRNAALLLFLTHLALNALWMWLAFGIGWRIGALAAIAALYLAAIALFVAAGRASRPARWILVPYLVWTAGAAALGAAMALA